MAADLTEQLCCHRGKRSSPFSDSGAVAVITGRVQLMPLLPNRIVTSRGLGGEGVRADQDAEGVSTIQKTNIFQRRRLITLIFEQIFQLSRIR